MFQIGDLVMYGSEGACRITDIRELNIADTGDKQLYYVIKAFSHEATIYAPVEGKVFIRRLISREQAQSLLDSIPTRLQELSGASVPRDAGDHGQSALASHDCGELLDLILNTERKRSSLAAGRRLGQSEEKYLRRAVELLSSELAAALDVPAEQMQQQLEQIVSERN